MRSLHRRARKMTLHMLQTLIVDLTRSLDEPQDSANLQIAVLSFFNALINYKAGQVRYNVGIVRMQRHR